MADLTLAQAMRIVEAALAKAEALACAPLAIAVLDAGGHVKALVRQDGAGLLRPDIAVGKAWGALGMGVSSRALAARVASQAAHPFLAALGAMSGGRVVPAPGGVLLRDADRRILGAVGISGDHSDKDEACAIAGTRAAGLEPEPPEAS
jgi:uncharacterized protein GlcG (DUF336 family)